MLIRFKLPPYENNINKEEIKTAVNQLEEAINRSLTSMNSWFPDKDPNEILKRLRVAALEKFVIYSINENQIAELKKMAASPTYLLNLNEFYENLHLLCQYLSKPSRRSAQILDQYFAEEILDSTWKCLNREYNNSDINSVDINKTIKTVSQILKNTVDISKDPLNETHISALNRNVTRLQEQVVDDENHNILKFTFVVLSFSLICSLAAFVTPAVVLIGLATFINYALLKIENSELKDNYKEWLTPAHKNIMNLNCHYQPSSSSWGFWTSRNLQNRYVQETPTPDSPSRDESPKPSPTRC
jgi:hypothetical protein